ncbi:MAG: hypothetical protein V1834_03260 [Candidatus Micrarchaeota archaeon]
MAGRDIMAKATPHSFESHPLWKALVNPEHDLHRSLDVSTLGVTPKGVLGMQIKGGSTSVALIERVNKLLRAHDLGHKLESGGQSTSYDHCDTPLKIKVRTFGAKKPNSTDLELVFADRETATDMANKLKTALGKKIDVTINTGPPYFAKTKAKG